MKWGTASKKANVYVIMSKVCGYRKVLIVTAEQPNNTTASQMFHNQNSKANFPSTV